MRTLVPIETESYETKRRRELFSEIQRLDASMNVLAEKFRAFAASNPIKHNPAVLLLKEMGLPDPHPELTELEEEREQLLRKWNSSLAEYASL
jgi:hypothetical protein